MSETNTNPIRNDIKELSEIICNGFECNNRATENFSISAGRFGIIKVSVCSKCKNIIKSREEKFSEKIGLADRFSLKPVNDNHQHNTQTVGESMHV